MVSSHTSNLHHITSPSLVRWLFVLHPMASWSQNGCCRSKYLTSQLCLKSERTIPSRGEGKVRKKNKLSHIIFTFYEGAKYLPRVPQLISADLIGQNWVTGHPWNQGLSVLAFLFFFSLAVLGLHCCAGFLFFQLLFSCSACASHCGGFSCCGAWCLGYLGFISCCTWAQ